MMNTENKSGTVQDIPEDILVPDGKKLLPFQLEHVRRALSLMLSSSTNSCYMAKPTHSYYNADEQGLGKSIQAIACMNYLRQPLWSNRHVLIVCPAVMRLVWANEIRAWSNSHLAKVLTVLSGADEDLLKTFLNLKNTEPLTVIISYDLARTPKFLKLLSEHQWLLLVMDEAHNLNNRKALRTKAVLKSIWPSSRYRLALSGTPFTTRVVDGFTMFNAMLPTAFPSFHDFADTFSYSRIKYFGGHKVTDYYGIKNAELLSKLIRKFFYGRHTKDEVLPELPAKRFTRIDLPKSLEAKITVTFDDDDYEDNDIDVYIEKLEMHLNHDQPAPLLTKRHASIRKATGLAKVPLITEFIDDLCGNGVPVVLFAYHIDVLHAYRKALSHFIPSYIDGSISAIARQGAIRRFQSGETLLFIGQMKAAGVGITLTASSTMVLAELDYSPANISQAVDRIHRIGTKNAVNIYYPVVENSLDSKIAEILITRSKDFKTVLNN